MVKRARRINREATPEILEALENRKMTISKAEEAIGDTAKAKKKTRVRPPAAQDREGMVQLNDENLAGLKALGGTLHSHVNAAVENYIASKLKKKANAELKNPEANDQKPD